MDIYNATPSQVEIRTKLGKTKKRPNKTKTHICKKRNIRSNMGNNIHTKTTEIRKPNDIIEEEYNKINKKEENGPPQQRLVMGNSI